ncbi:MAG: N-(5'-phosphoribosyl)anthranilate isomerase, partial [Pseudomonadota bacterium]
MNTIAKRRTRAKICGITRTEDALAAAAAGADAIGLVFYAKSPRAVTAEQAAAIHAALPPFITTVGLFVNADAPEVEAVLERVPLDLLQFHGDEEADYCQGFSRPYIKAVRMAEGVDLNAVATEHKA